MSENGESGSDRLKWIYILRQLLVSSGSWSCFFIMGLTIGAPTVVVPQLRSEANSTDAVSPEEASWLPAIFSYSGLPWVVLLPMITEFFGRKIPHAISCSSSFIGFLVFYYSCDVRQIMISMIFQGPIMASHLTVSIIIITEYTSSEYRGLFLTIKCATLFWGIFIANTVGTFLQWKMIPLLGLICSIYNLVTVYFWPESPLWLARQGRYYQCAKAHRWMKGSGSLSEIELSKLIANNQNLKKELSLRCQTISIIRAIAKEQFFKPVLLTFVLLALYQLSGKLICTVYAIDILKKITNKTSTAFTGMLVLDVVTLSSMYVGCALTKALKRRCMLLTSGTISVLFMFSISLYLYLVKLSIISENKYVSLSLLAGYSIALSIGPMIINTTISAELIPIESRSFALCGIGLASKIMYGTFIKVSPYVFNCFGISGAFLFFGLSSTICLVLIYLYLPETKDKTLQEIADCISSVKNVKESSELLPLEK